MEDKKRITVSKRTEVFAHLSNYDYLANKDDTIGVTQWSNCDGYTIEIFKRNGENLLINLTEGEIDAINFLTNKIKHELEESSVIGDSTITTTEE